jgi:AraC-like DNA-binding protein
VTADRVTVRFFMPSPALAPYISTYYLTEVAVGEGQVVEDWLHPEWANLRFSRSGAWQAGIGAEPLRETPRMIATGPTSYSAHFAIGTARIWGIGILPLGWARLVDGPANTYADRFVDARTDPAFTDLAPLYDLTFVGDPDPAAEARRIDDHLLGLIARRLPSADEPRLRRAHAALLDDSIASVADFAEQMELSSRSLERLSARAFGFAPKLLLRRQRFLRSLAQFMLDPSLSWIRTLDWHYVDQAHFVRDFKRFMGMSPSTYAAKEHPVMRAAASARAAAAGEAVQALHRP